MADSFDVQIRGLDELEKRLQALPEKLRRKSIRKAMQDGAELVRAEAERLAPPRSRTVKDDFLFFLTAPIGPRLKDCIVSRTSVGAGKSTGRVGVDYQRVRHGHLVEFGTKPHKVGKFHHPGARKHPFMRPAYDNKGDDALETMLTQLAKAVETEA